MAPENKTYFDEVVKALSAFVLEDGKRFTNVPRSNIQIKINARSGQRQKRKTARQTQTKAK